jgi:predicted transcriptional regulator
MIEQLFGSKTRVKLLQLFFSNPNRSFYVREITRKIDEQINSVRRELSNLLSIGIISSDTNDTNNRLYYEVNQAYEYFEPLTTIFGNGVKATADKVPTTGKQAQSLKGLGNVELALYTGQFTRDDSSGVDVLLVGDLNQTQVGKFISDLEQQENKELRYTVMTPSEFAYRRQVNDRFLSTVLGTKAQIIVDRNHVLSADPGIVESKPEPTEEETKE